VYYSGPAGVLRDEIIRTFCTETTSDAALDRIESKPVKIAVAQTNPSAIAPAAQPAADSATQPGDRSEPYRQLYARYKQMILKAVRAGDADEVAKLTSKFNETLGGKLLYVRVQKLKPGEQEQWEMLLSKFFTEKQWKLPIINYPMVGQPHVSFWDGYILILPTKLGGGRYEDNVYIEMAVEPATAPLAAQPVADSATMVAEALQRIHKRVAALEEQHPALKGIANAKPQFGGVSAFTSREADWSFANNATEWGKAETPSAVDPSKAFCRIILRMWTPSGPTVDSQPVADQRDYQVGGVPWGGYLKVWSDDSKLVEAVKAIVDEELDRATTSRLAAASQEEEADKTTVVTRIDKDALLKELRGVGKRSREDVGPGGWAASFLDAKKGEVFQFAIAVCSSREAAKTIYRRREHLLSVPPMPLVDCKVGDIRTSSRNWAFFVRDNVFVSVSWKDGIVDAPMLERLDKLLMTDSPLVARGQFSETPELKGLPATLEMTAAETKSLPVTWAGMGRKPAMWYVSSPGSMSNQVVDTTVQLKVSPGARENRHPVTVYAVGEGLVFATATVDVTIKPATTQPAAQPASPAKPGLRLRIDPKKLRLYNLSLADVRKALAEQKIAVAGGRVDAAGQHELNLDPDRLPKPEDLRRIVVTTQAGLSVPLEQFAEIFAVAGTNARDTARNELRARICLAATREAIGREITLCEKEIATYERLLDDGSRKQLSRMQNRLKQLREQAAHYAKLTPDEYRLPVPVHLEQVDPVESPTWTRCDLGEGLTAWKCPADRGLLYYVGMSKSGPFYRAVAAAAPIGKVPHQAVEVYPLFRSAYGFPEYYAYVEPIPAKSPAHEPGTVNLSAAISGRIATVDVELGQSVLKGQLLVTLDNSKLKASIMQAQAESEARRHAATTLRKKLANGEGPAEDAARATAEVARADAHLDRLKDELLKCEIRSPVNGTVTYSPGKVSIGKPVRPGDRLFTIRPDDATVPTTHRVASGASKPSVDPDIAWGPAVEGVQCRLQPDRAVWKAADVPTFRVDVRNNGPKAWVLSSSWMLVRFEVDGRWYVWSGPVSAQSTLVKPGQGLENVAFGTNCWRFKAEEAPHQPLKFTPGRHTIRVAFHSSPEDATKSKSIRVMSNPVEIEVLFPDGDKVTAAPKASFDAAELAQAHARTIKGVLPVGWTVKADGDVVTIRRNEKVQGDPASPVAPAPNEITWTATIEVRVGPRISMAEYCRMASANETARKEDRARHPNLSTVNYRIKLPHSLPTHLDAQSSLWISGGYLDNSRFEFKSKDVAEECRRVYETIKGMSRPYTPEWGSPVNGLQAGLDLERPAQAATGNLRLLFRLRNAGDKPAGVLRLSAQARFWGENLPIEVIDLRDGRKVMKYRGPVLEPPPPPPSEQYIQLAPGGIDSVEVEMNPAHWGTEDLSKVHAGFIFSNAHETENPGPGWPVITGLWTGRAMSPRIPLAPGTPRKPEDPKAAFVMPDVAYKRALDSYVSTGPRYILVTLVNATTGQSRAACIEPGALLGAIQREKAYARDVEGWNRTMAFALAQKDRTFRFSDPEACKRASPRYTPEILAEVRQRVNEMTTDEMVKEIGDQESNLYRFCVEGREGAYPYLDSVAHVLMERGIACGRSCKPGLLDVYGKMDEQQALPPAAQPTPPKTEDLSDRLKIEVNPPDNLPGGLYAVGPFDIGRGQSPDAHLLYQWRVEKKIGDGHEQLVGRLPLDVYGLGSRGGGSVEVLKFTRIGNRILGTLKHTLPLRGAKFPANSIYLRAFLPKLPAGEYEVEIRFEEHYHTGDGKISPAPEGTLPQMRPMTCKFQVPDKTAATRKPPSGSGEDEGNVDKAPWGEAVRGVQVRLQADKAAWDTTEVPVVKVDVQNNGKDEFHLIGWMVTNCFAHIDGVTYLGGCSAACPAPGDTMTGISIKLGGSTTVANGFSRVPRSSTSGEGDLRWSPGKHTVRVSFRMAPRGAPDNTPHVEVFSNPVTIEVAAVATDVPEHLRNWPGLFDRAGDKIVNAPPDDVKVAKGYVAFADKGKVHKGRRVTIMSAKRQYTVGEEVRVIHVLEAVEPGGEVFVMGPKTVFGEYIDGKDVTKDLPKPAGYNGRVLNSPAVDYNYAITEYTFDKPGEHTIQWKAAGPFDGEGLVSNVLNLVVVAAARASEESDDPAQWSKPALGLMGRLVVAAPRITTSEQFDLSLELRNNHFGGGPWLAVQEGNPFLFEVSVTDAGGKAVKPTMTRRDVLYSPKWQVIRPFPDERLSIPVSIRSVDGAKGSHLDTTTSIWKLSPGVYKIAATFTSPKEIRYKGEATPWTGKLELPPVEVEVVAADGDAPDINANVDNELRWGAPHLGLRCRLESGKAQVPMGATVDFQLHPRYDPSTTLDEQIGLLNRCDEAFDATLTFTETQTGKVFRRSPYDAGMPPSGPGVDDIVQLREDTMGPDRLEVYLLSDTGEQIPPGEYRVVATYDNTGQPKVEVSVAPDGSVITKPYEGPWEFWKGKIDSAPAILTVTEVEPEEIDIKVNSALTIKHQKDGTKDTIGWSWSQDAPMRVRVTHRPGYTLGRRYSYQILLGGKQIGNVGDRGGLAGGAWDNGGGMSFLAPELVKRVLAGEKLTLRADVEIFETSMPPQHMWSPTAGDFKVLWKGQIEGAL
ncbi:MAG: biotin/lipoyl-binding protein, partial [Planctomycetes bacterium]|nr:biotin/lipoyl-binding protein [Planctomycetota bacterium]